MSISFKKYDEDFIESAYVVNYLGIVVQKIYCSKVRKKRYEVRQVCERDRSLVIDNNFFELPKNKNEENKYYLVLSPYLEKNQTSRITCVGSSGSGKTFLMGSIIRNFIDKYPREVYMFTTHDIDPSIDDQVNVTRIDISDDDIFIAYKTKEKLLNISDLKDSFILFDDIFDSQKPLTSKFYINLANDVIQNSRKYGISSGYIIHNTDYSKTRLIFSESTHIILFLNSSRTMNKRILKTYLGFDDKEANKLLNIESRYLIIKNSQPNYLMTETMFFTQSYIDEL